MTRHSSRLRIKPAKLKDDGNSVTEGELAPCQEKNSRKKDNEQETSVSQSEYAELLAKYEALESLVRNRDGSSASLRPSHISIGDTPGTSGVTVGNEHSAIRSDDEFSSSSCSRHRRKAKIKKRLRKVSPSSSRSRSPRDSRGRKQVSGKSRKILRSSSHSHRSSRGRKRVSGKSRKWSTSTSQSRSPSASRGRKRVSEKSYKVSRSSSRSSSPKSSKERRSASEKSRRGKKRRRSPSSSSSEDAEDNKRGRSRKRGKNRGRRHRARSTSHCRRHRDPSTSQSSSASSEASSFSSESSSSDEQHNFMPKTLFGSSVTYMVDKKLHKKIINHKFINLAKLLPDNVLNKHARQDDNLQMTLQNDKVKFRKHKVKEITRYEDWSIAWDSFMSVYCSRKTHMKSFQHMLEYRRDIRTRHDLNMDWYGYDKQFRQEREKSLCKWNVQRPDLHMTYSQPLHPTTQPQSFRKYNNATNNSTRTNTTRTTYTHDSQQLTTADGNNIPLGHCIAFNTRGVRCEVGKQCRYHHQCKKCAARHPVYEKCAGYRERFKPRMADNTKRLDKITK